MKKKKKPKQFAKNLTNEQQIDIVPANGIAPPVWFTFVAVVVCESLKIVDNSTPESV